MGLALLGATPAIMPKKGVGLPGLGEWGMEENREESLEAGPPEEPPCFSMTC